MSGLRLQAWRRWQLAAGPFVGWAICPSLTVPDVAFSSEVRGPSLSAEVSAEELAASLADKPPTAIVLDLNPCLGVSLAAELNSMGLAHAVLVLPRWPHAEAILPCAQLIASLIEASRRLGARRNARHVVFALDGDRQKRVPVRTEVDRSIDRDTGRRHRSIDNRYVLSVADLPNLSTLREHGIGRVLKLS